MKFITTIYLILFASSSFCQTQIINTGTTEGLNSLSIIGNNIMVGGMSTYIAKSYNECNNLSLLSSPINQGAWCEIHRVDTNIIFIFSKGGAHTYIYKSIDGGINWAIKLDVDTVIGEQFTMFDSLEGIILCFNGECLRTLDGGDTWQKDNGLAYTHLAIGVNGDSTIYCSTQTTISYSKNRGHTWSNAGAIVPIGSNPRNYFLLDSNNIFLVATHNTGQYLAYSTNGGLNWKNRYFPNSPHFSPYDCYFLNINEGYLVGTNNDNDYNGVIYKTTDTGLTWTIYDLQLPCLLGRIEFLNDSIALISGTNGTLLKWNKHSWATEVINIEKENNIYIYPNPSSDLQTIEIINTKVEPLIIELFDISGRKLADVYKGNSVNGKTNIKYDLSHFVSGIYHYKIQIGNQINYLKTLKIN